MEGSVTVVGVHSDNIEVDPPDAKNIQLVPKAEFEDIWNIWEDYKNQIVKRHELQSITWHSTYIVSILHWYEKIKIIMDTISDFCLEFVRHPYKCYTEHGQHALFYSMLFNALHEQQCYLTWQKQKVCVLQKEYPTAGKLGKPQRQHWDIAVLKNPPESLETKSSYDYLKLFAAVEFGMNEARDHLEDDIARLCHPEANLEHRFIVHLYRLSESGNPFSGRDWPPNSKQIRNPEQVQGILAGRPVEIFYGLADMTVPEKSGVWNIRNGFLNKMA